MGLRRAIGRHAQVLRLAHTRERCRRYRRAAAAEARLPACEDACFRWGGWILDIQQHACLRSERRRSGTVSSSDCAPMSPPYDAATVVEHLRMHRHRYRRGPRRVHRHEPLLQLGLRACACDADGHGYRAATSCTRWAPLSSRAARRASSTYAVIQTLMGNMGRAGGGINALRGIHNVQGSTDMGVLFDLIPGYSANPGVGTSYAAYSNTLFGNRVLRTDVAANRSLGLHAGVGLNAAAWLLQHDARVVRLPGSRVRGGRHRRSQRAGCTHGHDGREPVGQSGSFGQRHRHRQHGRHNIYA